MSYRGPVSKERRKEGRKMEKKRKAKPQNAFQKQKLWPWRVAKGHSEKRRKGS